MYRVFGQYFVNMGHYSYVRVKNKGTVANKHWFYNNILPPYALVVTSDLSNAFPGPSAGGPSMGWGGWGGTPYVYISILNIR